ncbi:MAG TPA: hypothetical protein VG937_33775 [Polyangiaceae bacterium]|nr:hypothetical protein [Polyangiaceae bacterium]
MRCARGVYARCFELGGDRLRTRRRRAEPGTIALTPETIVTTAAFALGRGSAVVAGGSVALKAWCAVALAGLGAIPVALRGGSAWLPPGRWAAVLLATGA